jgi:hypothetical protein
VNPERKCKIDDDVDETNSATKLATARFRAKMVHLCFMDKGLAGVAYITGNLQRQDEFSGSSTSMSTVDFFIIIIIDCKWVYTRWQWCYNKTQPQNNTHHIT